MKYIINSSQEFSKVFVSIWILISKVFISICPVPSPVLDIVNLSNFIYVCRQAMVYHHSFNIYLPIGDTESFRDHYFVKCLLKSFAQACWVSAYFEFPKLLMHARGQPFITDKNCEDPNCSHLTISNQSQAAFLRRRQFRESVSQDTHTHVYLVNLSVPQPAFHC